MRERVTAHLDLNTRQTPNEASAPPMPPLKSKRDMAACDAMPRPNLIHRRYLQGCHAAAQTGRVRHLYNTHSLYTTTIHHTHHVSFNLNTVTSIHRRLSYGRS